MIQLKFASEAFLWPRLLLYKKWPLSFLCVCLARYRADNQEQRTFSYKEQVTRGGPKSMGSVLAETRKFLQFPDCTVPPDDVVSRFLDVCDAAPAAPSRCTAALGSAARGHSSC